MSIVITILAAYFLAYYTVNVVQLDMAFKRALKYQPGRRMKPLDCVPCLSVWLAVILYILPISVAAFILAAFGAGWMGVKIK
jgi:hypothetical protein